MSPPGFTPGELRLILRAYAAVRIGDLPPGLLREFIAGRLCEHLGQPALAARVRALGGEQMAALCRHVRDTQRTATWPLWA
jgi:hypothetical protein